MEAGLLDGAANVAEVNDSGFIDESAGCMGMRADILALMTMGLGPAAAKEMPIESKSVDSLRLTVSHGAAQTVSHARRRLASAATDPRRRHCPQRLRQLDLPNPTAVSGE
nr:hypothetical protein CFP56_57277 [Quercus suber]